VNTEDDVVYSPVAPFPTDAVIYAGDTFKKFASSFSSLYFSLYSSRLSVIEEP
jgi:hypothetical protein